MVHAHLQRAHARVGAPASISARPRLDLGWSTRTARRLSSESEAGAPIPGLAIISTQPASALALWPEPMSTITACKLYKRHVASYT